MNELKTVDFSQGRFTANGKEYLIESKISFDRYSLYIKYQAELSYGVSFENLYKNDRAAFDSLNKSKPAEAAVIIHNKMTGMYNFDKMHDPALRMCALVINTKDEDRRTITEEQIQDKLKDWAEEGLDVTPFFHFATSSIKGWKEIYNEYIQNSASGKEAEK